MSKMFSIIIPYFNKDYEISLILKSISLQTLSADDFEVVVVDDGSDKRIDHLINVYSKQFSISYHVLNHTANRGYVRNFGAAQSKGHYLVFLDSDILPDRNILARFKIKMGNGNGKAVFGFRNLLYNFDRFFIDEDLIETNFGIIQTLPARRDSRLPTIEFQTRNSIYMDGGWQLFYSNCFCISKLDYDQVGGFDEDFSANWGAEDIELGYRFFVNNIKIEYDTSIITYHLYHPENTLERLASLKKNYSLFLKKHPHWMVELFIREFESGPIEMIQNQEKIKSINYQINDDLLIFEFLSSLSGRTLLCGLISESLVNSTLVNCIFAPISTLRGNNILPLLGLETLFSDKYFETALINENYFDILGSGLITLIMDELSRICNTIFVYSPKSKMTYKWNSTRQKNVIFLTSHSYHFSINKNFLNLAVALSELGCNVGYEIFSNHLKRIDVLGGLMSFNDPQKIALVNKITNHELNIVGDKIPAFLDPSMIGFTTRCYGNHILWSELLYYNYDKEVKEEMIPHVKKFYLKRESDGNLFHNKIQSDILPCGIDARKLERLKGLNARISSDKFIFLWADQSTNSFSNLECILTSFTKIFGNSEKYILRLLCPDNKSFFFDSESLSIDMNKFHAMNANYRTEMSVCSLNNIITKYDSHKNIQFKLGTVNEDDFTKELIQADSYINLNSTLRVNTLVLESIALGIKPILLDNDAYRGYFDKSNFISVDCKRDLALISEPNFESIRINEREYLRYYHIDRPIELSLLDVFSRIKNNACILKNTDKFTSEFTSRYDWKTIAATILNDL